MQYNKYGKKRSAGRACSVLPWVIVVVLAAFLAYLQGKYLFCSSQLQHTGTTDTKLVDQVDKLKFELATAQKEASNYKDIAQQYSSLLEQYNVKDTEVKGVEPLKTAAAPVKPVAADDADSSGSNDWIKNTNRRIRRGRTVPQEKMDNETPDDADIHFVMSTGCKRLF